MIAVGMKTVILVVEMSTPGLSNGLLPFYST